MVEPNDNSACQVLHKSVWCSYLIWTGIIFILTSRFLRTVDSVSSVISICWKNWKKKTLERPLIPGLMRVKLDLYSALLDIISAICFKNSPFDVKEFNSPVPNTYTNWIQNISLKLLITSLIIVKCIWLHQFKNILITRISVKCKPCLKIIS